MSIADHGFGAERPPLFEVLLDPGGFVVTAQRRIDAFGQYPSPKWTRRAVESPIKDQHDLIGSTYVEMIANDPFKPHPASLRSVKHIGVGDLKLAEGLTFPGSPDRGFLLSDANQHDPLLAFASGDLQKPMRRFLLVLSFLE